MSTRDKDWRGNPNKSGEGSPADLELTAQAWEKLQSKLQVEERAPQWSAWSHNMKSPQASETITGQLGAAAGDKLQDEDSPSVLGQAEASSTKTGRSNRWSARSRRWAGAAVAACLGIAIVATPTGNQALAALLNQFRMQQVTEVQENDLESLLMFAVGDGNRREEINKFGTFTRESGPSYGKVTAEQAEAVIGQPLVLPSDFKDSPYTLYLSSTDEMTFTIHVDEINKAMKRMGASKLLPVSVDGKTIKLKQSPTLRISQEQDGGYSISQQPAPVIEVDPSVPVSEALEAVLDFPLLPEYYKESLRRSEITGGGSIPLPVVTGQQAEKIRIGLTDVLLLRSELMNKKFHYRAVWVQHGMLIELSGDKLLTSREAMVEKLKELVGK
ncbi:hypothetical protein WMW72_17770 [Paenibacillus filicis]|uniref:DUF4367 domain-containing protein n=1 Tax=Paenibacillus filicis TaxID=669464 RepID=A0ABU9DLM5_9BACL